MACAYALDSGRLGIVSKWAVLARRPFPIMYSTHQDGGNGKMMPLFKLWTIEITQQEPDVVIWEHTPHGAEHILQ